MNFEEAFRHCKEGVATQEEKDYVKSQLSAANSFLDGHTATSAPVIEAEKDDVKRAKKRLRRLIFIPLCVVLCALVAVGTVLGGVFGYAASSANRSAQYDKFECAEIARRTAFNFVQGLSPNPNNSLLNNIENYRIDDIERNFNYNSQKLSNSFYVYVIEIENGMCSFEIEVDTRNGNTKILEAEGLAAV